MRRFSKEEREIIERLVAGQGFARNIINLLDQSLRDVRFVVERDTLSSRLLFEGVGAEPTEDETGRMIERQEEISKTVLLCVSLIQYLVNNSLALTHQPANSDTKDITFGQGAVNVKAGACELNDKALAFLVVEYADKEIIPTYQLVALVEDKFETPEEKRFKKQMLVAWSAIAVSIAIGLAGIFLNVCGKT